MFLFVTKKFANNQRILDLVMTLFYVGSSRPKMATVVLHFTTVVAMATRTYLRHIKNALNSAEQLVRNVSFIIHSTKTGCVLFCDFKVANRIVYFLGYYSV